MPTTRSSSTGRRESARPTSLQAIGNYVRSHDSVADGPYATVGPSRASSLTALRSQPDRRLQGALPQRRRPARSTTSSSSRDKDTHRRGVLPHVRRPPSAAARRSSSPPTGPRPRCRLHDRAEGPLRRRPGGRARSRPTSTCGSRSCKKRVGRRRSAGRRSGALDLLARRDPANVRSLEGALIRARAFASLTQQPLTVELAEHVLSSLGTDDIRDGFPTPDHRADPRSRHRASWTSNSTDLHVDQTQPSGCLCSPGRHVPVPRAHRHFPSRDRPQVRRPRPHHGAARPQARSTASCSSSRPHARLWIRSSGRPGHGVRSMSSSACASTGRATGLHSARHSASSCLRRSQTGFIPNFSHTHHSSLTIERRIDRWRSAVKISANGNAFLAELQLVGRAARPAPRSRRSAGS